ncbi:hypothetical protein HPB50_020721 [Hyalomma asiaticum]|uniref:Uncharacterized protein n=1 Tax=Hyalomma asiaticum TaxID=266040 RepID=A0ACB7TLA8_HYAAI|nr:hypothetical protein HPB50_020721 [Hyalomma asiaticum]
MNGPGWSAKGRDARGMFPEAGRRTSLGQPVSAPSGWGVNDPRASGASRRNQADIRDTGWPFSTAMHAPRSQKYLSILARNQEALTGGPSRPGRQPPDNAEKRDWRYRHRTASHTTSADLHNKWPLGTGKRWPTLLAQSVQESESKITGPGVRQGRRREPGRTSHVSDEC